MKSIARKPVENPGEYLWKTRVILWKYSISIMTLWKSQVFFPQVFHNPGEAQRERQKAFSSFFHSFHSPYYYYPK